MPPFAMHTVGSLREFIADVLPAVDIVSSSLRFTDALRNDLLGLLSGHGGRPQLLLF